MQSLQTLKALRLPSRLATLSCIAVFTAHAYCWGIQEKPVTLAASFLMHAMKNAYVCPPIKKQQCKAYKLSKR
jgi:uncharacterized membrane protein